MSQILCHGIKLLFNIHTTAILYSLQYGITFKRTDRIFFKNKREIFPGICVVYFFKTPKLKLYSQRIY